MPVKMDRKNSYFFWLVYVLIKLHYHQFWFMEISLEIYKIFKLKILIILLTKYTLLFL